MRLGMQDWTRIHHQFIDPAKVVGSRKQREAQSFRVSPENKEDLVAREIDADSGRPFIKVNHPAPGDVIRDPAHVAGYGTAFEGTISLRIRDDDGTVIAEGTAQGGSNGVIGEFKANLEFQRRPNQRLGVVEAFEESASGSGEDLHLDRVPIVFG
jgi:hypothetical protein